VFEFAHLDTDQYWQEGVEIIFSKGRIKVELAPAFLRNQPARVEITKERSSTNSQSTFLKGGWTWAFRNQALAFAKNIATGTPSIASGEDSLNDLAIVESIWERIL
jgi:predicted dehydrogenase